MQEWGANRLFANISYEVDELRRDIKACEIGKDKGVRCDFVQDKLVVKPGVLTTKDGRAYAVSTLEVHGSLYCSYRIVGRYIRHGRGSGLKYSTRILTGSGKHQCPKRMTSL